MLSELKVSPAPHISGPMSTRSVMLDVIIGLSPAMVAAIIFFRVYAVILTAACVISAVLTEYVCNLLLKKENPLESLGDLSAVVTGIILAFSIPPKLPVWAAVIGSVFAIAIGKMVFGGLGANIFNPAMAGRAFLMASFGVLMTTWTVPATIDPAMPQIKTTADYSDIRTQATPLALSKEAVKKGKDTEIVNEQMRALFFGNVGGCIGETSALALLIGGIYLLIRKTINFHTPLAVLLSAFVFALVAYLIEPQANINPVAHLLCGGLLIGAFFIATDPVTAPLSIKGMWLFGIGVGTITMLIRIVGEYPEGVMFSILLMNAVTPLIDRLCKLTPAGGKPNV
jgi:electron transport complex protein RnfD